MGPGYAVGRRDRSRRSARTNLQVLTVTPDGGSAFVGGDNTVTLLDTATGNRLLNWQSNRERVGSIAVAPDGRLVVIGAGNALYFWKWKDEKEPTRVAIRGTAMGLVFSPDGTLLAESHGGIHLRDVATRAVLRTLETSEGNVKLSRSLLFTAGGSAVIGDVSRMTGDRITRSIAVWDASTGRLRQSLGGADDQVNQLAVSRNGRWLAAVGTGMVRVWDLSTGRMLDEGSSGHSKGISGICLSFDGHTAVTGSDDNTARIWDANEGVLRHSLSHEKWIRAVALSPDAKLFATSSLENTVRVFETATGNEVYRLHGHGRSGGHRALAFSTDGRTLASWGDDLYLRVFDVRTGKALSERRVYPPGLEKMIGGLETDADFSTGNSRINIMAPRFDPTGRRLIFTDGATILIFDTATGRLVKELANADGMINTIAATPDAEVVAVRAFPRGNPEGDAPVPPERHCSVRVRELATDRELFRIPQSDRFDDPIAFSADGRLLAVVASSPPELLILDGRDGTELQRIEGLPPEPRSLGFSGDKRRIACGFDGPALIWNVNLRFPLAR